jgi:glycosyltransferase involved in cell wall biosynthesis
VNPLVSIVIPCFNAESWIAEAIESGLKQTYPSLEIIVIDDGSTDKSLDIIQSYRSRITFDSGPNRGGNHARNRGLELSRGDFIQFLDADDYLLPAKIGRQLEALQRTGADVIYEDWQRLDMKNDGTTVLHPPEISGPQDDVLEALLRSWAPPPCALLFKRSTLERVGGWNEELPCAQDWELNVRIAISGAIYAYLRGCYSIYRRPHLATVSTRDPTLMHNTGIALLKRIETVLTASDRFPDRYKRSMAHSYFVLARTYYYRDPQRFWALVSEARRLSPNYLERQNPFYRWSASVFGLGFAEMLANWKRRLTRGQHQPPVKGLAQ